MFLSFLNFIYTRDPLHRAHLLQILVLIHFAPFYPRGHPLVCLSLASTSLHENFLPLKLVVGSCSIPRHHNKQQTDQQQPTIAHNYKSCFATATEQQPAIRSFPPPLPSLLAQPPSPISKSAISPWRHSVCAVILCRDRRRTYMRGAVERSQEIENNEKAKSISCSFSPQNGVFPISFCVLSPGLMSVLLLHIYTSCHTRDTNHTMVLTR